MKNTFTLLRKIKYLFVLFCVFAMSSNMVAQKHSDSDLKNFEITIKNTKEGIKMKSHKGSKWLNLSFTTIKYIPQAINEDGMTSLKKDSQRSTPESADYLFTIKKTNKEIKLVGLRGTAWEELSFSLAQNATQTINQLGMVR